MDFRKKIDLEFIKHSPFALSSYSLLSLITLSIGLMLASVIWQQHQIKYAQLMAVSNQLGLLDQQSGPQNLPIETIATVISAEKSY